MKILKNKRGINLTNYLVGLLLFAGIVGGVYLTFKNTISSDGTFWEAYGYTVPANNLTAFDKSENITDYAGTISCDIIGEDSNPACIDRKKNPLQSATGFISGMVQGGYGGLVTIYKSFGTSKVMLEETGSSLNIDPFWTGLAQTALLLGIIITILFIIFNRSDTV